MTVISLEMLLTGWFHNAVCSIIVAINAMIKKKTTNGNMLTEWCACIVITTKSIKSCQIIVDNATLIIEE